MNLDNLIASLRDIFLNADNTESIALIGEMGAGKTHFVRCFMKSLDISAGDQVTSPTFTYRNQYIVCGKELHHYDLYRIDDFAMLESIGFWESFMFSNIFVMIEWANKFPELSEHMSHTIQIEVAPDKSRNYYLQ